MSDHHAKAIFTADDSSMSAVMDRMGKKLEHLEHSFHGFHHVAEKALELTGVALLLEHGFEAFHEVLEKGHGLEVLSAKTGASISDLVVLEAMFRRVGGGAEDAEKLIGKMQKSLAEGTGNHLLAQMGLDPEQLRKMNAVEAFEKIGKALMQIPNAGDRAAASMELLGKSGRSALAIFAMGHVDEMLANARQQAEIYDRSAGTFSLVHEKMSGIPDRLNTSWLILADRIAETLMPLLDQVNAALDRMNGSGGPVQAAAGVGGYLLSQLSDPNGDALGEAFNLLYTGADNFVTRLFGGDEAVDPLGFGERAAAWQKAQEEQAEAAKHHGGHGEGDDSFFDFGKGAMGNLTALGAVGGNWGGGAVDPWLDEARTHTRLLETIAANTGHGHAPAAEGHGAPHTPAYAH